MAGRAAPRYAPEDPTLPKPWRGLVDGTTGYLYYWNPDTNVTQYERPLPPEDHLPPPPPLLRGVSSAAVASSDRRRRRSYSDEEADDRYNPRARTSQPGGGSLDPYAVRDARDLRPGSAGGRAHLAVGEAGFAEEYRRQHEILIIGDNVPPPFPTFESTAFPADIMKEIHRAGFEFPTPIQAQSWPIALEGNDIVAVAKTGSGKTLGYLLPGFLRIKRLRNDPKMGPTVLVLAPTRELATQIEEEVVKFGRSARIAGTCLYGGAPKGPQLGAIDRGVDIVVATPGRLWDIMEMRRLSLRQVSYLVLDEADRMLDMGFEPQIRKIIKEVPTRRQTLMFTATWPKEVRRIADDLLVHPVQVNIGRVDELVANSSITQIVEVMPPQEKLRRLEQILRSQDRAAKVLIFCITKRMCDQLARNLMRYGVAVIHGDKSQNEREKVLNHFRSGRSPILVATDVAARGLDIKDIRMVINYDFPTGIEDYVHRIGRTGRAGATGIAHTFFSPTDARFAKDLIKILEGANQRVPHELRALTGRGGGGGGGRPVRGWRAIEDGMDAGNLWGKYERKNQNRAAAARSGYDSRPVAAPAPDLVSYDKYDRYDSRPAERERDRKVVAAVPKPPSWHDIYNRYATAPAPPSGPPSKRPRTSYPSGPSRSRSRSPRRPRTDRPAGRSRDRSPSPKRSRNLSRSPKRYSTLKNRSRSPRKSRSRSPRKNRSRSPNPKNVNPRERSPSPNDKTRDVRESRSPSPKPKVRNPRESRSPSPKREERNIDQKVNIKNSPAVSPRPVSHANGNGKRRSLTPPLPRENGSVVKYEKGENEIKGKIGNVVVKEEEEKRRDEGEINNE
ncbi:hypothetical protein LUZ60_001012 [Juncus effusus]|nr:hypothetical protein LUZ60_001012 [Juncus effusus]